MKDTGIYKSFTHGPLPASAKLKRLMHNLRASVQNALRLGEWNVHGRALSHARGELVKYVGGLETDLSATKLEVTTLRHRSAGYFRALEDKGFWFGVARGYAKRCGVHLDYPVRGDTGDRAGTFGEPVRKSKTAHILDEMETYRQRYKLGAFTSFFGDSGEVTPFTNAAIEHARADGAVPPFRDFRKAPRKMVWGDINPSRGVTFDEINPYFRTAYPAPEPDIYAEAIDQMVAMGLANKSRIHRAMLAPYGKWDLERRPVPPADLDVLYWPPSKPSRCSLTMGGLCCILPANHAGIHIGGKDRRSGKDRRIVQDWCSPQMRRWGGDRRKS